MLRADRLAQPCRIDHVTLSPCQKHWYIQDARNGAVVKYDVEDNKCDKLSEHHAFGVGRIVLL